MIIDTINMKYAKWLSPIVTVANNEIEKEEEKDYQLDDVIEIIPSERSHFCCIVQHQNR